MPKIESRSQKPDDEKSRHAFLKLSVTMREIKILRFFAFKYHAYVLQ